MDTQYPELDTRRHLLRTIFERLESAYEDGKPMLTITVDEIPELGECIGLNPAKTQAKVKELVDDGYLRVKVPQLPPAYRFYMQTAITILALTDRGKLEIGAIPDPRQRLIQGFEGAIREIEANPTLDKDDKRKRIKWANEAIAFVRGLSVEIAARILTGEIQPR